MEATIGLCLAPVSFTMQKTKFIFIAICCLSLIATVILGVMLTPSVKDTRELVLGSDRVLLAADGQILQTLRTDFTKRRLAWYPLSSFGQTIREAVIAAEDRRFHWHLGFDPIGLLRALRSNLAGHRRQGASTITMQLVDLMQKDVLLQNRPIPKGSIGHKILQLVRAVLVELKWSKDEILEAYLNLIHLRGEYQGVPAFSYAYLKKHPLALDAAESLVVAAMISSPNQGRRSLAERACGLAAVVSSGEGCAPEEAVVEALMRTTPSLAFNPGLAPHLARRVFRELPDSPVLTSFVKMDLQQKVAAILEKNLHRLKEQNVHDSAAIVIENKTGQVVAYVGALPSSESPHVDGVQAYRQAGSTLKPFLYARGLEAKMLTASSILLDDPTSISWGQDVYRPTNYDKQFYGPVSVREALGSSLNVPAVKIVTIIGLHRAYLTLQSIGLTGLKEPDFYGVSMALGAVEVRLDDLSNAYRLLANDGTWSPLRFVDSLSEDIDNFKSKKVFSTETSFIISSILSDPNARSIGFGWDSPLETPFWTVVKTGTSKDYRDNWCVGYSERYTVGVWTGNFNAEAMNKVSGVSGAGPSWYEIMSHLHAAESSRSPTQPDGLVAKPIRHPWASYSHREYFIKGTEPTQEVIESAGEKSIRFVFPAEGSVLVKDPHQNEERSAYFIRFKGLAPKDSRLVLNGQVLGEAVSPFKVASPTAGSHILAILSKDNKVLSQIRFSIRGGKN